MEQDTLAQILRVETELREQLDAERSRAAAWLAATRRDLEAAHQRDLEALRAAGGKRRADAEQRTQEQARQVVRQAEQAAGGAGRVPPEALRTAVRRHLAAILPGGAS